MICAVVNATEAYVWFTVQYFIHSQLNAVYRRAGTLVGFNSFKGLNSMQPERVTDRYGVTHSGLGLIGSHHYNFSKILNSFNKISYPRGSYTIIVSNKNDRLVLLFSFSFCHKMRKSKAKNIPLHPVKKINNGRPVKRSA